MATNIPSCSRTGTKVLKLQVTAGPNDNDLASLQPFIWFWQTLYQRCVLWCKQNHLQLNLTKETTVDQLRSFNMCRVTLCCGQCVLDAVTCWSSRLRVADASTLNALIHKAGDAVGVEPDSLKVLLKRWMLSKMRRCWKVSPTHSVTCWPVTGAAQCHVSP